jgi:hypothetical protein
MENQHRQTKGYRDLSQHEIDLINRIKAHAEEAKALHSAVREHLSQMIMETAPVQMPNDNPYDEAHRTEAQQDEYDRIARAEPHRWLAIAKTDLQTGYMAMTRAVAQPSTF